MELWHDNNDNWQAAQDALINAGLTDGLPVVPPTAARVRAMLDAHGFDGAEVITDLPPLFAPVTWQDVAINAVMAGCLPAYLPVVGAAVEGIAQGEFNLVGIATTTGSASPMIIVNGPVVQNIGLNAEGNVFGPGHRANATIGRALTLVLRNVGGAIPGELDMSTIGQPAKYTCCIAENETASPWAPLHVERGFDKNDSVVTVVGISGSVEIVDSSSHTPEDLAQSFAQSMLIAGTAGSGGLLGGGEPLLVMPPEIAQAFQRAGCNKAHAKALIHERAVMPRDRLSSAIREHRAMLAKSAGDDPDADLRIAKAPDDVMIVVAGGVGIKAAYLPTWSGMTKAISVKLRGR
jgi:hypothetical protein